MMGHLVLQWGRLSDWLLSLHLLEVVVEDVHLEGEGGIPEGVLRPAVVHRAPVEMLQADSR